MRIRLALGALVLSASAALAADSIKAGDPFPEWKLTDHNGVVVSSKDMAGKTYLLWFYPRAMTPGCTAEGDGLRDNFPGFKERGVEILGVSFDEPTDNARFVEAEHFPFRLLTDKDRKLAVAVGAAGDTTMPMARRISYLVGPDGRVLKVYATVNPVTHATDVLADVPTR
jgi:peroxiredoxin Q/BCP